MDNCVEKKDARFGLIVAYVEQPARNYAVTLFQNIYFYKVYVPIFKFERTVRA